MTHRVEKHITSKNFVIRVCKSAEGYLDWICHSTEDALLKQQEKEKATSFKKRDMLKKTVAMLMTRAISRSDKFAKFIELAQEKGGSAHKLLKRMLIKQSQDEYLLRIFIRKPKHRKQLFKLVNGYPNPMYPEHAMVSMNEALLKEERVAMRKEMKCLLDEECNISPWTISSWILVVLNNSLYDMDGAEMDGFKLGVHPVQGVDSYSCLLQFVNMDNKDEVHDVTLDIKIAIEMQQLPDGYRFQHPFPRSTAYEQKGRQLLKEIYGAFQDGSENLILHSDLYKSAAPKLNEPAKKKSTAPKMTRLRLQQLERSRTAIFGKRRIEDKKVWTMDFSNVEFSVHKSLSKSEHAFRRIDEAFKCYSNLTILPSKIVPRLNGATRVALSLWLFKNSGSNSDKLFTYIMALLHLVHGCVKGNFCPAFFQPAYNTMAPKITENNPMGITMEEVISDLSDLDTTDEEDDPEADDNAENGGKAENGEGGTEKRKKKKKKKPKEEKEIKLTPDEKVEELIELIEKNELDKLIDFVGFH